MRPLIRRVLAKPQLLPPQAGLREATLEAFAPEFAALSEQAKEELLDAIGAALSLEAWIVLRRRDGLSFERAASVWRLTLEALLAHGFTAAATE